MTPADLARIKAAMKRWRTDPAAFAQQALGIDTLRAHQLQYLDYFGQIVSAKRKSRLLGLELTNTEKDMARKLGVSLMSGRGSGKDMSTALCHAWFASMFEPHLVLATGPNRDHLRRVYWAEVEKWVARRKSSGDYFFPFADDFKFTATSIERRTGDRTKCLSIYRTVQKDTDEKTQAEGVSGFHEKHVMYIIDEASSVPYAVYSTLKASCTRVDDVRAMAILFNPNRNHGFAYDIHFGDEGQLFIPLHWDMTVLDCGDPEAIEEARRMYGEESNYFRVNFRGLPPLSDSSKVIPYEFIAEAFVREPPKDDDYDTIFLVDPAGEGKDRTTLLVKKGPNVKTGHVINEAYSDKIADRIIEHYHMHKPERFYIDKNGVGMGVFSILRSMFGAKVVGVNTTEKARRQDKFPRLRDELWWRARDKFEAGLITIPSSLRIMAAELAAPGYTTVTGSMIKVDPKDAIRKILGGRSPDWADALVLGEFHDYEKYNKTKMSAAPAAERPWDDPRRRVVHTMSRDPLAWLRG